MAETPIIEVAPIDRGGRTIWRATLPKNKDLTGRLESSSREWALQFAHAAAELFGWHVHEQQPGDENG